MHRTSKTQSPTIFFIALMAMMSSYGALSTDIMLPSLPAIEQYFSVSSIQIQKVVTFFFLGVMAGELLFGPLSDRYGRKPLILGSSLAFIVGTLLCIFAPSYEYLLIGRVVQGFGAAGPKIVIRAMLRDLYSGAVLARVFSLVYTLFIFIPMLAPLLGQGLANFGGWIFIFIFLLCFCCLSTALFSVFQSETLDKKDRLPLHVGSLFRTTCLIFAHQKVRLLTVLTGIIFGIKLTYLSNAQQMFADLYAVETLFPVFFALLSTAIGIAFFLNAKLVEKTGGYRLCAFALYLLVGMTSLLVIVCFIFDGVPPLWLFMLSFYGMFFSFGLLWGNVAALAMDYLGAVAGLGSTLMSAGSSLVAFGIATVLGMFYSTSLLPMAGGFLVLSILALCCFHWVVQSKHEHSIIQEKLS